MLFNSSQDFIQLGIGEGRHEGPPPIRVLLADPRPLMLCGLSNVVQSQPSMEVVGHATVFERALALMERLRPDVLVLGSSENMADAAEMLSSMTRFPQTAVVLVVGRQQGLEAARAAALGARRLVFSDDPTRSLVHAILECSDAPAALRQATGTGDAALVRLTSRELQLIRAVVGNPSAKYVAVGAELGISEHTVHNHLSRIYQKLKLVNRADLVAYAVRHRIATDAQPGLPAGSDAIMTLSASASPSATHRGSGTPPRE